MMIVGPADEPRAKPEPTSLAAYYGLDGRIIRLEEQRKAHEKEHTAHEKEHGEHVATKKWVYQKGWAVAALVAVVASSIAVALLRALL